MTKYLPSEEEGRLKAIDRVLELQFKGLEEAPNVENLIKEEIEKRDEMLLRLSSEISLLGSPFQENLGRLFNNCFIAKKRE